MEKDNKKPQLEKEEYYGLLEKSEEREEHRRKCREVVKKYGLEDAN